MKTIALILAFIVLIPAIALACSCCPPLNTDNELMIQSPGCHSCCPELTLPQNTDSWVDQKPALPMPQHLQFPANDSGHSDMLFSIEKYQPASSSPPPALQLKSPVILRI